MDKYTILRNAFWNYCYDKGELHCAEVIDRYIAEERAKYDKQLMACGHVTTTRTPDGKHYCVICDCEKASFAEANLFGRKAKCYCGNIADSDISLAHFKYKPNEQFDSYYCGCGGWD